MCVSVVLFCLLQQTSVGDGHFRWTFSEREHCGCLWTETGYTYTVLLWWQMHCGVDRSEVSACTLRGIYTLLEILLDRNIVDTYVTVTDRKICMYIHVDLSAH